MQLVSLSSTDRSTDAVRSHDAVAGVQRLPTLSTQVAIEAPQRAAQPDLHRGLKGLNPQFNQQVATAQQTLTYLGEMAAQLQTFKGQLSREVSGGFVQEGALRSQQQKLQQLWQELPLRSGGALCDVGPTALALLGLSRPAEMTGRDLRDLTPTAPR